MRILITGVCGFVGSQLALGLRRRFPDAQLTGIDNLSRPGSHTTRPSLLEHDVQVRHGDVRSPSDFESLADCDWVIDAAANPSVLAGIDGRTSSRQLVEHNLLGTLNVLEFCKHKRAGLVLLSTSRLYSIAALSSLPLGVVDEAYAPTEGSWPAGASRLGIDESFSTSAPISLYGATKLASEAIALEYRSAFGLPIVVNRCGVIAGAGQFGTAEQGIFSFWIGSWAARAPLKFIGFGGSGHQVRDALHPDDLTSLVALQIQDADKSSGIWNIGGGARNAMSLARLSRWCGDRLGHHEVARDPAPRQFDVPWMVMNSGRAASVFGWQVTRSLDDMLSEIAEFHLAHPEWLALSRPL